MPQVTVAQALQVALQHHQAGRLAEAEGIYRQVLAQQPSEPDALHLLGVLAHQAGRHDQAAELIHRAIRIKPDDALYFSNLGNALTAQKKLTEAVAAFSRSLELKPDSADGWYNLANALRDQEKLDEAITAYSKAIELKPDFAGAYNNLAISLNARGKIDEAAAARSRAIQLQPALAQPYNDLLDAEACTNDGNALRRAGKLDEAIAAHNRAIQLRPDFAEAYCNLGAALAERGRVGEAIAASSRAIELKPPYPEAYNNLANALSAIGKSDEALVAYRRAIDLMPDYADACNNLGGLMKDRGQVDQALAWYERAIALSPDNPTFHSNRLYALHFDPQRDATSILEEHRRWNREQAEALRPLASSASSEINTILIPGRRLKIGFISPDLRSHPVGRSLLLLLSHRDRDQFDVFVYSDVCVADSLTDRLRSLANTWRPIVGESDDAVARLVRDDGIDILVDLALHTANNRLLVFARKPARVQLTMLGPPTTTGLSTMDYRLTDPFLDPFDAAQGGPPGQTDAHYSETSIRLPDCFWCYQPPEQTPPVNSLPAQKDGLVTFGSLNQFAKVSRAALQTWAKLLAAVPRSRLLLQSSPGSHLREVRQLFEEAGIAPSRLDFVGKLSQPDYYSRLGTLDLSLDPFPFNGHTSSMDSLWMGVPVITLAGRTSVGRGGVSILSNVGLGELIAASAEQYIEIASRWANDLPRLAELRATLRRRMRESRLMDASRFARNVEAAYKELCQRHRDVWAPPK